MGIEIYLLLFLLGIILYLYLKYRHIKAPSRQFYVCIDGHLVRSRGEWMIDAALQYLGIRHEYEPRLKIKGHTIYPDFDLGNGIYLEYWGLETKAYRNRRKKKEKLYKAKKFKVISIENEDLKGILAALRKKLQKFPQFRDKFTKY